MVGMGKRKRIDCVLRIFHRDDDTPVLSLPDAVSGRNTNGKLMGPDSV